MAKRFFWLLLTVLVCAGLCGCKTKYIPMETVRTEYVQADTTAIFNRLLKMFESRREKTSRVDSLIDRTKEVVVLSDNGDTTRHDTERIIYRATAREKELETENKTLRDSVSALNTRLESIKTDSIPVIVPVERELSKWEQVKMDFGGVAAGVIGAVIAGLLLWLVIVGRRR